MKKKKSHRFLYLWCDQPPFNKQLKPFQINADNPLTTAEDWVLRYKEHLTAPYRVYVSSTEWREDAICYEVTITYIPKVVAKPCSMYSLPKAYNYASRPSLCSS